MLHEDPSNTRLLISLSWLRVYRMTNLMRYAPLCFCAKHVRAAEDCQ